MQQTSGRSPHVILLIGCALAVGACAVDDGVADDAGEDAASSAHADEDTGAMKTEPTRARGISIDEVEINQGTRVPIGFGADWVDGSNRLGYLIASRDTLMRIHYSVDEGWEAREIEARLTLNLPDGSSETLSQVKRVEQSSKPYSLDGTFWFGLIADMGHTAAGTSYQVELWETEPGAGESLEEGLHTNPAVGPQLIGFESVPLQIKLVLVPIEYQGKVPDLSGEILDQVINNVYEQNPTTEILHEVHAPVSYTNTLSHLGSLLPLMSQLRAAEQADPNVYYHALVDIGQLSLNGVLGISQLANDKKTDASSRVSATVLWSGKPATGADTFTHEHGHAQGLFHVECPGGGAAGPDVAYPHDNGRIGNWGFGIRRFLMHAPDGAYDYMSYCSPSWVSDWTWNKTYRRIKTLTSWDFESNAGTAEPQSTLLIGAIYPDGSREWWTVPGAIDPEQISGQDRFEFELDGQIVEGWAELDMLSDGETQWVKVELPAAVEELGAITHFRGDAVQRIEPATIGSHHAIISDWRPSL